MTGRQLQVETAESRTAIFPCASAIAQWLPAGKEHGEDRPVAGDYH